MAGRPSRYRGAGPPLHRDVDQRRDRRGPRDHRGGREGPPLPGPREVTPPDGRGRFGGRAVIELESEILASAEGDPVLVQLIDELADRLQAGEPVDWED